MTNTAVIDIGYGDAGKGAVVDRLCAKGGVSLVVRFNGGCQAEHNVVLDNGTHHTFSQFGSGTLQGVPTHLSRYVMVEPFSLAREAEHLKQIGIADPYAMLTVSPLCPLTTPYHWLVNRWREDTREQRHGSCGRGVGETAKYALDWPDHPVVADLWRPLVLARKMEALRVWARHETEGDVNVAPVGGVYQDVANHLRVRDDVPYLRARATEGDIVFEGAQGVLLDEHVGFHPHTTWSTVTPDNAYMLAHEAGIDLEVLAVTRAYSTRHGAGPFVPEDNTLDLREHHNQRGTYQGAWRVGHLDVPALHYGLSFLSGLLETRMIKPMGLYVTHADAAATEPRLKVCTGYVHVGGRPLVLRVYDPLDYALRTTQTRRLVVCRPVLEDRPHERWSKSIEMLLDIPVIGVGYGPRTSDAVVILPGQQPREQHAGR